MLKRILNIFIAASLVLLMMLSGVAHEFVHSFIGHEDTIHHVSDKKHPGAVSFENEHHHCNFLEFPAPLFLASSIQLYFYPALKHTQQFILQDLAIVSRQQLYTSLRGPPALV